MNAALCFDTNADSRPLLGHLGLDGCVAVGRYLFAGATAADGSVPEPIAAPLTADEVTAIHGVGLAVLPIDNGIGWGDTTGPNARANGERKATQAIAAMRVLGVPAGCYLAIDLETWDVAEEFFRGYCAVVRGSAFGGAGIVYGSAGATWRAAFRRASLADPNVARALVWTARYIGGWDGSIPAWDPQDGDPRTVAWQFCDHGAQRVDLSVLRLPLPSEGTTPQGLWLADGTVGSPKVPSADWQARALAAEAKVAAIRAILP